MRQQLHINIGFKAEPKPAFDDQSLDYTVNYVLSVRYATPTRHSTHRLSID